MVHDFQWAQLRLVLESSCKGHPVEIRLNPLGMLIQMPERISLHSFTTEMKAVLSVGSALSAVKWDDVELTRFDRLKEHLKQHRGTLKSASAAIAEPVTCQVIAIIAMSHLVNWSEGGAEAAL